MVVLFAVDVSGNLELWSLITLAVLYGAGDGFFYPAYGGIVPLVVDEHHLGRLLGRLGALLAHSYPDVGALQRRSVVDAVAGHRDYHSARFPCADDTEFVFGCYTGIHANTLHTLC